MIVPVVLSGGAGSRLWPLSRELYPKQLIPLLGELSLLQTTIQRLTPVSQLGAPLVICNEQHRFMVAEQLRQIHVKPTAIILEPEGRNTAPAITIAALYFLLQKIDPILLVLPADHMIQHPEPFYSAIQKANAHAQAGKLITFGILPTKAETAYGYIKAGSALSSEEQGIYQVECFVEKPDFMTAQSYVAAGHYYWNSGMFMFKASQLLAEMEHYAPAILKACQDALANAKEDIDFLRLQKEVFAACPSDSIDYAVMEKTTNTAVIPVDIGWNDVGSWSALWEVGHPDPAGNVLRGDVFIEDVNNSYLHADARMLAVVGMSDCIVMETADAVLVAHKERCQDVKKIVHQLKHAGRTEAELHRRVYRPWGFYEAIDEEPRFKVKRITVNPGASLSLQVHHHRSEHWIVVTGTAQVTRGNETFMLAENQSTYIPIGTQHRLVNPGKIPLEIIEVQSGSYLGEDDIIRYDDVYGRDSSIK